MKFIFSVFIILLMYMNAFTISLLKLKESLPNKINGWNTTNDGTDYNTESLYHYIDGGAELYISYGFNNAFSLIYEKKDQPEIRVEIFDMSEAKNAFGVFSISSEKNDSVFGQGSQYIEGSLIFWKNNFFISIMAGYETEESKNIINKIATIIDESINETGNIPEIMSLLPTLNITIESNIYFYHHAWQNTYYFISDENIFNISKECNAALSQYKFDNKTCTLLLIEYPDLKKASEAHNKFMVNFFDEFVDEPIVKLDNEKWMASINYKNYIISIFNASTKECVESLSNQVQQNINMKQ